MKKAPRVITLGSPFHGAPLERIGHLVDRSLALTPFSAPFTRLGRIRSAGITDLRHGFLADRDDAVPGLAQRGLRVHALAATLDNHVESLRSNLLGDGLVPVDSALGRSSHSTGCLPLYRQRILTGVGHLELLTHPAAGRQVLDWLAEQP